MRSQHLSPSECASSAPLSLAITGNNIHPPGGEAENRRESINGVDFEPFKNILRTQLMELGAVKLRESFKMARMAAIEQKPSIGQSLGLVSPSEAFQVLFG